MTDTDVRRIVAEALREARSTAGLSYRALARACGARAPQLSQWEHGNVLPRLERLDAVFRALGAAVPDAVRTAYADIDDGHTARQSSPMTRQRGWEQFVAAWQRAGSVAEVAKACGITVVCAGSRAAVARKHGVRLKRMPRKVLDWTSIQRAAGGDA